MFRASFLLCLLPTFATAYKCAFCATTGLRDNWQMTGYPIQPADMIYDDACGPATDITNHETECPTHTCVEMLIPTSMNTWEALRGCHGTFTGSSQYFTQQIPGVTYNTDSTKRTSKCTQMKPDGRGTNAYAFTEGDPDGTVLSQPNINLLKVNTAGNELNPLPEACIVAPLVDCVQCSYLDGKGKKCSKLEDGSGKGALCGKTTGKLNGRDYEERGPSYLLATSTTSDFCIPVSTNSTTYYNSFFGTSVTRTKRSINQNFDGQTCYCTTAGCNSAPTVLATSMTLVTLLAVLPFFC